MSGGFFTWLFIGLAVACLLGYWVGYDLLDWLLTPGKLTDLIRH